MDIVASPEWFGYGWNSFWEVVMRRELAERISGASPCDFKLVEIRTACVLAQPSLPPDQGWAASHGAHESVPINGA